MIDTAVLVRLWAWLRPKKQGGPSTLSVVWRVLSSNFWGATVIAVLLSMLSFVVFEISTAYAAFKCNGDSFVWGLFGFLFPFVYVFGHVINGLKCGTVQIPFTRG